MKTTIALIMLLFFVGIGSANEKLTENPIACWSLSHSINPVTEVLNITGSPSVLMVTGEYIYVEIWDRCDHMVYSTLKSSGSNSLSIPKSAFTDDICFTDGDDQYFDIYIEWNSSCGFNSYNDTIFF